MDDLLGQGRGQAGWLGSPRLREHGQVRVEISVAGAHSTILNPVWVIQDTGYWILDTGYRILNRLQDARMQRNIGYRIQDGEYSSQSGGP